MGTAGSKEGGAAVPGITAVTTSLRRDVAARDAVTELKALSVMGGSEVGTSLGIGGPGGGAWASVLDAFAATEELKLKPEELLRAFQTLEKWTMNCASEAEQCQHGIIRVIDELDADAARVLKTLARFALAAQEAAASTFAITRLQSQMNELENRLEDALDTHQAIMDSLENMLPVSQLLATSSLSVGEGSASQGER